MHPFVYSENINRPEEAEERTSAEVRPKHSPQSFCNTFFCPTHFSCVQLRSGKKCVAVEESVFDGSYSTHQCCLNQFNSLKCCLCGYFCFEQVLKEVQIFLSCGPQHPTFCGNPFFCLQRSVLLSIPETIYVTDLARSFKLLCNGHFHNRVRCVWLLDSDGRKAGFQYQGWTNCKSKNPAKYSFQDVHPFSIPSHLWAMSTIVDSPTAQNI